MSENSIQKTVQMLKPLLEKNEQLLYTQEVIRLRRNQHIGITNKRILQQGKEVESIPFEKVTDFLKGESKLFFFFNNKNDGVLTEKTLVLQDVTKINEVYKLIFPHWRKRQPEILDLNNRQLNQRLISLQNEFGLTYSIKGMNKELEGSYKGYPVLIRFNKKLPVSYLSIDVSVDNPYNLHFNLSKESGLSWDWFRRKEHKTRDKKFDGLFYLISDNVELSKQLFTHSIKQTMTYCQRRGDCVWSLGNDRRKKLTTEHLFSKKGELGTIESLLDDMMITEHRPSEKELISSPLRFTASISSRIQDNGDDIAEFIEKGLKHVFEMVDVVDNYYQSQS